MLNKNSDYKRNLIIEGVEGIIDTGIIVIAHFDNPIRIEMLTFLKEIFSGKRRVLIPLTTFIGAYHIMTNYLRIDRYYAKVSLNSTLNLDSPYFFEDISKFTVLNALDYASVNNIESWDAYLLILANQFNTHHIYTIDQKLAKLSDISIINPVSEAKFNEYQQFLKQLFQKPKSK
jgi:predicted nucleic acid-binding protein